MSRLLRVCLSRLLRLAERTSTSVDELAVEVLAGTQRALPALVALLIGLGMLELPERWSSRVGQLWFLALALQATLWANRFVTSVCGATPNGTRSGKVRRSVRQRRSLPAACEPCSGRS